MKTLLIVPCYNEEDRIDLDLFKNFYDRLPERNVDFLFANDGSTDNTSKKIRDYIKKYSLESNWFVFDNYKNTGKSNVVFNAYHWSKKHISDSSMPDNTISIDFQKRETFEPTENLVPTTYEWYGYWDADLATPLSEVSHMFRFRELLYPRKEVIFGSRVLRLGAKIVRNPIRHFLGRAFATLAYLLLKVNCYDSQCGAKLMTKYMAEKAFAEPFISRWVFDLEILLRVGEINITEYPLIEWVDMPGSKIQLLKEARRVLEDLFAIKKKYNR